MAKPKVRVKAIRFAEEELALLDMIQGHTGIRSRTEALRAILKHYVESEGVDSNKGPPPAKP